MTDTDADDSAMVGYNPDPPAFAGETGSSPKVRFVLGILFAAITLAMLVIALHLLGCLKEMAGGSLHHWSGW